MKNKIKNNDFLKRLFDFSFKKFITTKIVRFIFWVNIIIAGIIGVLIIVGAFKQSIVLGILAVILSPIFYIVYVAILRVILEVVRIVFRIEEHVEVISKNMPEMKKINEYEVKETKSE